MKAVHRPILLFCCALVPATAWGQLKDVRVSTPTRLDWEFAVRGFGPGAARLPEDYTSRGQRYKLYVPKSYKPTRAWPLVLFVSAGDDPAGWEAWKTTCEKRGVFFCSPYKAGNSCPAGQRTRIILDVLDDVRRHYRIDPNQTYASGISGGGRMACAIAFALPEWFAGVAPFCGTNPIVGPAYLRHRAQDRLSVAFVTGTKDFNRKENQEYMYPFFQELGIRTKLWVPEMGHTMPAATVVAAVYTWLADDLPRRQADAKARPDLAMSAVDTPTGVQQAERYLTSAEADLKQTERVWRGISLLQGVIVRWGRTEPGQKARQRIKDLVNDPKLLEIVAQQGAEDEQRSLTAQARALERFGLTDKALEAWELLARNQPDRAAGRHAAQQAKRLREAGK